MILFMLFTLTAFSTHAEDDLNKFNQVSFSVKVSQQVDNDTGTLNFRAHSQNKDASTVNEEINRQMQAAKEALEDFDNLTLETSSYRVYPVYNKYQDIKTWRGEQTLTITTKNLRTLPEVLQQVQKHLKYSGMRFNVSSEKRQQVMDELMLDGLKKYQAKAKLIANSFGEKKYRITATQIGHSAPISPYRKSYAMEADMGMVAAQSAPVVESGKSQINLDISGLILIKNH